MLRHIATLASVGLFATTALHAQQTVAPEPVPVDLVPTPPFSYNGLVRVSNPLTYGSGSMIGEGVMATAAHVVFNDDTNTWIEPSNVRYYPQSDSNNISFGRTSYSPVAMYRWTEYSARAIEDTSGEGSSTPNTFNMDFAVGYFSAAVNDPDVIEHAEVHIDPNGEVTIHRHPREKMIVGYPQDEDHIPSGNLGLMHLTPPDNYYAEESIDNDGFDFGGL